MSEDGKTTSFQQRPTTSDRETWKAYWRERGQLWRTEPEINVERQKYLDERRSITPDIEQGIYPFKDIKLCRADIEWLLATHENGRGPVDWSDPKQRGRDGLDIRGADLRGEDLRRLPLTKLCAGFNLMRTSFTDWKEATVSQREAAAVHLEGANLFQAHLEGASLWRAYLIGANLEEARLEGANLFRAHLEDANLSEAYLAGADLRVSFFTNATTQRDTVLGDDEFGFIFVADLRWSDANLALIKWPQQKWMKVLILGDELEARQSNTRNKAKQVEQYEGAVRANRQLATVLRDQGLNELADHFAYRAQLCQRVVWKLQRRLLKNAFSWLLFLLAGYGYRPLRSVFWYVVIIVGFALAYDAFGHLPLFPDTLIFSLTSFHGRGFFPSLSGETNLHNPLVVFAAFEAVVGLFIEISFIATFTQRFFGR
jgi:uncharacterized protein YjbI with pentapeptide repeats